MDYEQQQDLVYGYKDGMALVMDVYTPRRGGNGRGILWVAAGGWTSLLPARREALTNAGVPGLSSLLHSLVAAGYTLFAAAHSSQPRYTLDELRPDLPRALRFIRHHAARFGVDPQALGVLGGSSGGHVALLSAAAPPPPAPEAEDPVDRETSEVQAVVAFFPPTDLCNYGRPQTTIHEYFESIEVQWAAPFEFRRLDPSTQGHLALVGEERLAAFAANSPLTHLGARTPPVLLLHGDQDRIVPLQQSQVLAARLAELGVEHRLVLFPGMDHAWPAPEAIEREQIHAWFGRHLGVAAGRA